MAENFNVTGIATTVQQMPGGPVVPAVEVSFTTIPHDIAGKVVIPQAVFSEDAVRTAATAQAQTLINVMEL